MLGLTLIRHLAARREHRRKKEAIRRIQQMQPGAEMAMSKRMHFLDGKNAYEWGEREFPLELKAEPRASGVRRRDLDSIIVRVGARFLVERSF